jgi:hypothetical protein
LLCSSLLLLLPLPALAGPRLIEVTDPDGNKVEINAVAVSKLRPHKGGCVITLGVGLLQHTKEPCPVIHRLMEGK